MKGSDLLIRCLEEEGVPYVFGVPGEENLDFVESLRTSSIELVVTRHEQHAAFMAATYGRLTGRAGVCLSTLGPGATNLVTAVAHGQLCGAPMVAITGQKATKGNWQGNFQQVDVVSALRPITKWNLSLDEADTIPRFVRHAFKVAESERPGATHIEVPEDIAAEETDHEPQPRIEARRPVADATALDEAYDLLRSARTPIVIVSAGANRKRVGQALLQLADCAGVYVVSTQMGKGVFPDDHPRSLFTMGIHKQDWVHWALERADVVVTLGYDIVEYPPSVWNQERDKRILHVDFNPAEPDEAYHPDLEVVGDIGHTLARLAARFQAASGQPFEYEGFERLRAYLVENLHAEPEASHPPNAKRLVWDVRDALDREDVIGLDNGIYKIWFARHYPAYSDNTVLLDNALGTMGAGLAIGMTAKLLQPEHNVVAICGDGGFMMNSQDLETAVRLRLGVVILLVRDDAYGFIRWKQQVDGFPDFGMTFGNPDFVLYAQAYGALAERVTADDPLSAVLPRALEQARDQKLPVLIDCPIDYSINDELLPDLLAQVPDFDSESSS